MLLPCSLHATQAAEAAARAEEEARARAEDLRRAEEARAQLEALEAARRAARRADEAQARAAAEAAAGAEGFELGSRVEARYRGRLKWFPAQVTSVAPLALKERAEADGPPVLVASMDVTDTPGLLCSRPSAAMDISWWNLLTPIKSMVKHEHVTRAMLKAGLAAIFL